PRADLLPASRAGEDRRRRLPRQLPERQARAALGGRAALPGADDPAPAPLRAAASGLGVAMLLLVFIRDLGSSLMFFGAFLALLYVATNRFSYVLVGLVLFAAGAWAVSGAVEHVRDRFEIWLDPFAPN